MKKLIVCVFCVSALIGCGGETKTIEVIKEVEVIKYVEVDKTPKYINKCDLPTDKDYILVAGQSNAVYPDWSYFEDLTGYTVLNIAVEGKGVEWLIDNYTVKAKDCIFENKIDKILFVHGEYDSFYETPVNDYVEMVEEYRDIINPEAKLFISTVGYGVGKDKVRFDNLRNAVLDESEINNNWIISYNESQYFDDWGMMKDWIHYTDEGNQLMMEAFANSLSEVE
tara:strand:+ start:63 stop:737 length:675 start_codon:yes stop_codon:yes gene_type:complete